VYIGQAAHCSGTGGQTDTDGCQTQSLPNGTPVEVTGASKPGTLVYDSWTAMQAAGEADADTCACTLQLSPVVLSNGVSDLRRMLAYMRSHGGPDVTLAAGTEPFTGSIIG